MSARGVFGLCLLVFLAGVGRAQTPLEGPLQPPPSPTDIQLMIMAGSSNVTPSESPASRVDPNTLSSWYGGVGSLKVQVGANTYIGSGSLLTPLYVLTAAHVLDINGDGTPDTTPGNVTFYLNYGGSPSHAVSASALYLHPAYNGHVTSLNDDIAIVQLSSPITGALTYDIARTPLVYQTEVTLVGYGWSGHGDIGFTESPSYYVKRAGTNYIDGIWSWDDEGTNSTFEVWYGDFDWPDGVSTGFVGGASVDNRLETTLGGGDSGGPGFIWDGSQLKIVSVNTFAFNVGTNTAPKFGSGLGGIHVPAYAGWIDSITGLPEPGTAALVSLGMLSGWLVRRVSRQRSQDPSS